MAAFELNGLLEELKMKNAYQKLVLQFVIVVASSSIALGQAGVSSMSSSALSAGIRLNHEEIRIEELVNFHRHQIPLPAHDQRINLDARWWRVNDNKIAFQIGLATHRDIVKEFRTPLNLVLVIDRSGSMDGDRLNSVKKSLVQLVKKLSDQDLLSIVTYDTRPAICIEAAVPAQTRRINAAISTIKAGGSTNLHGGLMLGYEVAQRHQHKKRASRVILLTDGIANAGVVDHEEIANESRSFNKEGIGLSTIALGNNFNRRLLRELAEAGDGALHFIGDHKDIQKTFVDEFDSLLSPAAKNISLTIRTNDKTTSTRIFGYQPKTIKNGFQIESENMNYGATQVVIGHVKTKTPIQLSVNLDYFDSCTSKQTSIRKSVVIGSVELGHDPSSVRKNYTIAKLAAAVKSSAYLMESEKYRKAHKRLRAATSFARSRFKKGSDADVDRVFEIAKRQQNNVETHIHLDHELTAKAMRK